ncbi:hypothetical protein [Photobacterium halotolerans]|uniref:hypothetical protein n=1 Tax=Photobacterium halotolerans TaxID=265726 RepID=UPI000401751C|nr:hypothetical protein [Photobacterium halotolerans]
MANKKNNRSRTIYYYRAEFKQFDGLVINETLEEMVINSWSKLNSTSERSFFSSKGRQIVGMKISPMRATLSKGNRDCTTICLGIYEEGADANTISRPSNSHIETSADTYSAPVDKEYLDGEAFMCLYGNHIILSPTDLLRAATALQYFESLLNAGGYGKEANTLNIHQIADIDTLKTIHNEGIKNISINSSVYVSTFDYLSRNNNFNTTPILRKLKGMAESVLDCLYEDDDVADFNNVDSLNANIVISHDSRVKGEQAEEEGDQLSNAAFQLIESDLNGYRITTKKGKTFTHDKIIVKSKVDVPEHGKSVNRDAMWGQLVYTLQQYEKSGVLEQ